MPEPPGSSQCQGAVVLLRVPSGCPSSISKGRSGYPMKEIHFGHLYLRSYPFGHYPQFVTTGEGWSVDWLVNWELCILAQLLLHHNSLVPHPHYCSCCPYPPVSLTLDFTSVASNFLSASEFWAIGFLSLKYLCRLLCMVLFTKCLLCANASLLWCARKLLGTAHAVLLV